MGFEVTSSKLGYIKLSDATEIAMRVSIVDIEEGELKPVGPDLRVGLQVSFVVKKVPEELKRLVRDKPLPPSDGSHLRDLDKWEIVKILEKDNAVEECLYRARDGKAYKVSVEVEVTVVARTLEYRDRYGNPVYHLRWSPWVKMSLSDA